jgi:hypothetical protein
MIKKYADSSRGSADAVLGTHLAGRIKSITGRSALPDILMGMITVMLPALRPYRNIYILPRSALDAQFTLTHNPPAFIFSPLKAFVIPVT